VQTATADPLVGRLLEGRYRILDRIARGGMSTVYAAVDERLDRRVAVKVMSSALSADPAFSDRFAREARAAARLTHVNTVAVYDQGHDSSGGGHHVFLVMELVQGRTLRDLIRERVSANNRFTTAEAISIMEPVLSALSAAHRAGLVHRDVKPENILLSDDGLVKVADFGLARAIDADAASTRTGLMMGTVAYCAPEQIVHGRSDQSSDVYSAGIVLFELLTGRPPYVGDSAMSVAYQHVHSRVPAPSSRIKQRPSGIPTLIDEIVVAATDSDPAGRPSDASAFLAEIADARASLALPVVPIPPRVRPAAEPRRDRAQGRNGTAQQPAVRGQRQGPPPVLHGPRSAATTDVMRNGAGGQHDTEIVQRRSGPRTDGPPPPIVIPPPKQRRAVSPRARRRRRRIIAAIVVLMVGLLSVFGGIAGVRVWQEWNTHVPKVAGSSIADATAKLRSTGYAVDTNLTKEFSETVPTNRVIRTEPAAGTRVSQGQPVGLVVSLGKDRVPVPDVASQSLFEAETLMKSRGLQFNPSPRTRHSIKVKQGHVIGTDPAAGSQVKRTQLITFIVSSGPPKVAVPKIAAGTPFDQAQETLTAAKFQVSRVDEFSDTIATGTVISVDPGDRATYGTTVTVTVSKGPEFVTIPNFAGLAPLSEVQPQLEALHLHVVIEAPFGNQNGRVLKIDPPSGTQVHPGDTVTLTVV
jgi:beta-lactam-binding protein with PASTA domain/serine/threonine protein kinase